jgi:Flp pilus assembly protein TadD
MAQAASLRPIVDALQAGRPEQAERLARERLADAPGFDAALTLLGLSLHAQGRFAEAADAYGELAARFPRSREHWSNYATMLRASGRLDEAEAAYRRALELAPADATLCLNIGLLRMQMGDVAGSRDFLLQAHRLEPEAIDIRVQAALMSFECGDNVAAQRLLDGWAGWRDVAPELWLDLGWILGLLGHVEDGERYLLRAATREQDRLHAEARLAMLYERSHRLDEARTMLERLPPPERIEEPGLRNDVISARAAVLARGEAGASAQLERLLSAAPADAVRTNLLFVLARERDRAGDAAGAMQALQEAHALQAAALARIEPELAAGGAGPLMRAARDVDAARFRAWPARQAPAASASPIFVVGFPRSGTTMLEQMLDAHPALSSMDERAFLQDLIDRMASWGLAYPDGLADLTQAQCDALRAEYERLAAGTGLLRPGSHLVDKNPLNLLRLPVIARLFPEAPVVLALRHPCDVLLSCYMQNFRSPAFALICASLETLAQAYANAMRFWIRHAELMRPRVLALRYEDLLGDFPGYAARLAAFLGLEDAQPMLRFHEHARRKRFISTPSYAQVVRPPSTGAIGRWRAYERWFEPVLPTLRPLIAHWGYEA